MRVSRFMMLLTSRIVPLDLSCDLVPEVNPAEIERIERMSDRAQENVLRAQQALLPQFSPAMSRPSATSAGALFQRFALVTGCLWCR